MGLRVTLAEAGHASSGRTGPCAPAGRNSMSVGERASSAGARPSPGGDLPPTRAARRREDTEVPRFYRRVLLAVVLPGAGLLRTRWRVVGAVVLLAFLGAVGYAGWRLVEGG
ncbi:MAG: hypothetical protein ACRCZD_19330, partial [Phycicoccus sp.]